MNNTKSNCPPLTQDEIIALRGQPVAKIIEPGRNDSTVNLEEWTYFNIQTNNKESYVFKNGKLIEYKNDEC